MIRLPVAIALFALLAGGFAFAPRAQPALSGQSWPRAAGDSVCFDGVMNTGPRQRRVVLSFATEPAPGRAGTLTLHTRPPRVVPVALTTASPGALAAASIAGAPLSLHLALRSGADWGGEIVTGGDTLPLVMRRTAEAEAGRWSVGHWSGVLEARGVPLRLGISIATGPCGILQGTFDSPDQGQTNLALTAARIERDSLIVEASYLGMRVAIPPRGDAGAHQATVTTAGLTMPIALTHGRRVTESRRPQEPQPPLPYVERTVVFENSAARLRFEGTLTVPPGPGAHPALLLLSGSGSQDRDETVAGHRPFLVLADYLTRRGFVVFRFDDRGAGRTGGTMLDASLEDLAGDAAAALAALRAQTEVDPARTGLLGHSEGGYVAQMLASRDSAVRFLVMLAAPAMRGREVLLSQRIALNRAEGTAALEVEADSLLFARLLAIFDQRPSRAELSSRVDEAVNELLGSLDSTRRARIATQLAARTAAEDSASLTLWRSRWFESLFHHDPVPYLRQLRVPVLALHGELDLQVPADPNLDALEAIASRHPSLRLTVRRFPGVNHMMQRARTGRMAEYITIEETVAQVVLDDLGSWLDQFRHR